MNARQTWEDAWSPDIHQTEHAKKRIKSAKSAKLTPVRIDKDDMYGYFQGKSGRYETFLDSCPCGDFRRYKLPCKHIYRLAIELGLLDEKAASDKNAIYRPKRSLRETVDAIEALSNEAQETLYSIMSANKFVPSDEAAGIDLPSLATELVSAGLAVKAADGTAAINQEYSIQHLYRYLRRKVGIRTVGAVTENGFEELEIPIIKTELPMDAITQELIRRGYYDPDAEHYYL